MVEAVAYLDIYLKYHIWIEEIKALECVKLNIKDKDCTSSKSEKSLPDLHHIFLCFWVKEGIFPSFMKKNPFLKKGYKDPFCLIHYTACLLYSYEIYSFHKYMHELWKQTNWYAYNTSTMSVGIYSKDTLCLLSSLNLLYHLHLPSKKNFIQRAPIRTKDFRLFYKIAIDC